jgi:hypothetical protein
MGLGMASGYRASWMWKSRRLRPPCSARTATPLCPQLRQEKELQSQDEFCNGRAVRNRHLLRLHVSRQFRALPAQIAAFWD